MIGKGGRARSAPVEPPLEAVLDAYLASRGARFPHRRLARRAALFVETRGEPLQRGGLQYLISTTLRWAGLNDRRARGALVHALRHTFATRLAEDGATATEIMNLLGHASLTRPTSTPPPANNARPPRQPHLPSPGPAHQPPPRRRRRMRETFPHRRGCPRRTGSGAAATPAGAPAAALHAIAAGLPAHRRPDGWQLLPAATADLDTRWFAPNHRRPE